MYQKEQLQEFLTAEEVMGILHVKQAKAYNIIRDMNRELTAQGYLTVRGRVDANYFRKKVFYQD